VRQFVHEKSQVTSQEIRFVLFAEVLHNIVDIFFEEVGLLRKVLEKIQKIALAVFVGIRMVN